VGSASQPRCRELAWRLFNALRKLDAVMEGVEEGWATMEAYGKAGEGFAEEVGDVLRESRRCV